MGLYSFINIYIPPAPPFSFGDSNYMCISLLEVSLQLTNALVIFLFSLLLLVSFWIDLLLCLQVHKSSAMTTLSLILS